MSQVSSLIDAWAKKKSRKREATDDTARLEVLGAKGSVDQLVQSSKHSSQLRSAKRQKTFSAAVASNVIARFPCSADSRSSGSLQTMIAELSTRIRIMKRDTSREFAEWVRLEVLSQTRLNDKLTLLKTGDSKLHTVVLQGVCSSSAGHVTCYFPTLIQLYSNVFWCLDWKLS